MNQNAKKMKNVSVANFNTVFLLDNDVEAPLLEYFDTIVMPALQSGIQRTVNDDKYIIMNTEVEETEDKEYVLRGYIVKKTVLERLSDLDSDGNLIEMDDRYSAAPFSLFIIYLKNHRMIYVENQKGSPKLSSFRSTIKYIIDSYVREQNRLREEEGEPLLPIPLVNVVGIPSKNNLTNELREVEKINQLTLRFFPLNGDGDIDFSGSLGYLANEARKRLGCKTGAINYNSPDNIPGVIDVLSEAEGTIEPILKVTDRNNVKKTIRNDKMSERMKLNISGDSLKEEIQSSIVEGSKIDSVQYTSQENAEIYSRNVSKIIPFLGRK
jgi:hypothetical protein